MLASVGVRAAVRENISGSRMNIQLELFCLIDDDYMCFRLLRKFKVTQCSRARYRRLRDSQALTLIESKQK